MASYGLIIDVRVRVVLKLKRYCDSARFKVAKVLCSSGAFLCELDCNLQSSANFRTFDYLLGSAVSLTLEGCVTSGQYSCMLPGLNM